MSLSERGLSYQTKLGPEGLSKIREDVAKATTYALMQDPNRIENFYGLRNLSSEERQKALGFIQAQLVEALTLYPIGRGVSFLPDYTIANATAIGTFPLPGEEQIMGQVFSREDKPSSADFVHGFSLKDCHFHRKFKGKEIDATARVRVLVCCDGATMLVPPNQWPDEVQEKLSFMDRGRQVSYPDIFWRTIVQKLFDVNMPGPYNGLVDIDGKRSYQNLRRKVRRDYNAGWEPEEIAKRLIEEVNKRIGKFLQRFFRGFGEETYQFYPSGIMGVAVIHTLRYNDGFLRRIQQDYKLRRYLDEERKSGSAYCGDIRVTTGDRINKTDIVDVHDRLLDGLEGRKVPGIVIPVARMRTKQVGNLQGFPVDIHKNFFKIGWGTPVLMYTDGADIGESPALEQLFHGSIRNKNCLSAACWSQDPFLALLLKGWQYFHEHDFHSDDCSYILWQQHQSGSQFPRKLAPEREEGLKILWRG